MHAELRAAAVADKHGAQVDYLGLEHAYARQTVASDVQACGLPAFPKLADYRAERDRDTCTARWIDRMSDKPSLSNRGHQLSEVGLGLRKPTREDKPVRTGIDEDYKTTQKYNQTHERVPVFTNLALTCRCKPPSWNTS